MIAPNFTNEPCVAMNVAWFDPAARLRDIADCASQAANRAWPFVALVVEIARRNHPSGVLRVMVDAQPDRVTRATFAGRPFWYAPAECNWTRDELPEPVWDKLDAETRELVTAGVDDTHATMVVLAHDGDTCHVCVERVASSAPHSVYLESARECGVKWPDGVLSVSPLYSMFDREGVATP